MSVPEIKRIYHVPERTLVWRVPIIPDISNWTQRFAQWDLPTVEDIYLDVFDGERYKYGYGPRTHTLVIADIQ